MDHRGLMLELYHLEGSSSQLGGDKDQTDRIYNLRAQLRQALLSELGEMSCIIGSWHC